MKLALYLCLLCYFEFEGGPGPKQGRLPNGQYMPTQCPMCANPYLKWLNAELWGIETCRNRATSRTLSQVHGG